MAYIVVVLLCALPFTSAINPKISFISGPEIVRNIGETVELECRVENGKEYPINWIKIREERGQKYEYLPLSTGKTLAVNDPRIKLTYDSSTSGYTLAITDIQAIDAAKYQCQVIVGINNKISRDVDLKIRLPAGIEGNSTSSEVTVVEGEPVELNCPATGFPTPRVHWVRLDGKVMPDTTSITHHGETLKIDAARKEDRGEYKCTAENNVGTPVTRVHDVQVRFGPSIEVPRPRIHQAVRHGVTMVCEIEAYPAPSIFWTKNGERVVNDDSYTVIHFSRGDTLTASTVQIAHTTARHFGTYECRASNVHGEETRQLELVMTKMPIPEAAYGAGVSLHSLPLLSTVIIFGRLF